MSDIWGDRDELDNLLWDERNDSSQLHDDFGWDAYREQLPPDVGEPLDPWVDMTTAERAAYRRAS